MTLAVKSKENDKQNRPILLQCTTLSLYAAKTDMTGRRIDGLRMARSGAITAAIIWRAKVRTTLKHLSCDSYVRHCRVKALIERNTTRVLGGATSLHRRIGMAIGVIIRRPLPDIADHVEQPEGIGRIGPHGGGPQISVLHRILDRKLALPDIGFRHANRPAN